MQEIVVGISDELREHLRQTASLCDKPEAELVAEALEQYLELSLEQIEQIKEAVVEADGGQFVEHDDVKALLRKYIP